MGDAIVAQQGQHGLDHTERGSDRLAVEPGARRTAEMRAEELVGGIQQVDLHDRRLSADGTDRQPGFLAVAAPRVARRAGFFFAASS